MNGLYDNLLMSYFGLKTFIEAITTPFYVIFDNGAGDCSMGTTKSNYSPTFEYSTDLSTWTTGHYFNSSVGSKVYVRRRINTWHDSNDARDYLSVFNGKIGGNIMSLLYGDQFNGQTEFPANSTDNFNYVFGEGSGLTYHLNDISELILPATTLTERCYQSMFSGCTAIRTAPVLPATTLAVDCYHRMFQNCTGLITPPALPATTLANYCYNMMFSGCTALTIAPVLPAEVVGLASYSRMFEGCTSLRNVTCLATDISATFSTSNWLKDVSPTGVFTKAASMSNWTTGVSGIPEGWTVEEV